MKKRLINPLIKFLQFIGLTIIVFILIVFFCALADWSRKRNSKALNPISESKELNEIEQYHKAQGRSIIVFDDL